MEQKEEHGQGLPCTQQLPGGHSPAQRALPVPLHPQLHSQHVPRGNALSPPQGALHCRGRQSRGCPVAGRCPAVPWQGRGSRMTFLISQLMPSLKAKPPRKEICKGKAAMASAPTLPTQTTALTLWSELTPKPLPEEGQRCPASTPCAQCCLCTASCTGAQKEPAQQLCWHTRASSRALPLPSAQQGQCPHCYWVELKRRS